MSVPTPWAPASADASVSMLRAIVDTALDPDYERLAAQAPPVQRPHRPGPGTWGIIVFAVAGLVLGIAIADVRSTTVPLARQARDVLEQRVRDRVVLTDNAENTVAALRDDVAALTQRTDNPDSAADRAALDLAAASTAVTGPGVVITIDDAEGSRAGDAAAGSADDLGRVLDRDLQQVVNGLWAAGADAIAINDQRLTSTSAIRAAGEAILVDYRPLEPPYRVTAIGNPQELRAGFSQGASGLALRTLADTYGIRFDIVDSEQLEVPAGSVTVLRVARPVPTKEPRP
jgi:uncharacterized protein YlxW (UPF0749 family)